MWIISIVRRLPLRNKSMSQRCAHTHIAVCEPTNDLNHVSTLFDV